MDISPIREGLVKITLNGRLDTPGVDRVEARFLASLVPDGNSAIVDLSHVGFVSSLGIRMIVSAAKSLRTQKATLAVYGVQERVNQVFEIVSLGQVISICSTESEALAAVAPALG